MTLNHDPARPGSPPEGDGPGGGLASESADESEGSPQTDSKEWTPPVFDTSLVHSARRYNYWLGGKDNYAADRESGDVIAELFSSIRIAAIENRGFLGRAVTTLAGEFGVRQFLDIGCGLPSADNTHEVAQRVVPRSRVVYVDNDPLVMVHARALLTSDTTDGVTDYIEADLRKPDMIVREARHTLDFDQPVALMLVAILHFIANEEDPYGVVARLIEALPSGSFLVMSHATGDHVSQDVIAQAATGPAPVWLRSRQEFAHFFDGLPLLPPGIVSAAEWRAQNAPETRPTVEETSVYSAIARIP
jgi:hypothetical protein